MNEKLGFVVLHYNTENETKDCVASIIEHLPGASIVVVDNGSPNGSGKRLEEYFKNQPVSVLLLDDNLGFAKGNNAGIKYIRKKQGVEYIVVINNDTLILQDDFLELIDQEYHNSKFAVMGPKITSPNGDSTSNPVEYIVDSKNKVRNLLLKRRIKLILNLLHLNAFLNDVGKGIRLQGMYDSDKRYENVKLHGACWIFSPVFFNKFDGLCDKTFLYFEEDILYLQLKRRQMKTVYNPELNIIHLEDVTSTSITNSNREKNIFVLRNEIQSLKVLNRILD